jgi:hypothetical protein
MHSIFLDGQVEAACSRADGSGSVDVLPGSLVPGFFQTREGTKMLRVSALTSQCLPKVTRRDFLCNACVCHKRQDTHACVCWTRVPYLMVVWTFR